MAIPIAEFPENPLNCKKINKNPKSQNLEIVKNTNPNLKSIWAFLSFLVIYICVFYIFNLSPSTLIYSTKFWFFISNTLILIAAIDFAAFSSEKQHVPLDEGHVLKYTSSKSNMDQMIVQDITSATSPKDGATIPFKETATWHNSKGRKKKCTRINSENATVAEEEGKAMVMHRRTLSERHDYEDHGPLEEEKLDEFSRMSNEELNTRVEEFIRRFNRQIRLQAVMNRQNLEKNEIQ